MSTTLTAMQVASTLCISLASVRWLVRHHVLRAVEANRFSVEDVRAFLASGDFEALRAAGKV